MDFLELAAKRRSVRKYDGRVPDDRTIELILKAAFTAPSSKNCRSTRIAIIKNRELLRKISGMRTMGSAFIADAPIAFMIMADDSATDLWSVNSSISATMVQFAAEDSGLGSCWVQVDRRPHTEDENSISAEQYLHEVIPQTRPFRILCVIAAGYPEKEVKPRPEKDDSDKVIFL